MGEKPGELEKILDHIPEAGICPYLMPTQQPTYKTIHMQASDATALAFLLLQGSFVWHKCLQVDNNHGLAVIFWLTNIRLLQGCSVVRY